MTQGKEKMTIFAEQTATDMGTRKDTAIIVVMNTGEVWCFGSFAAIYDYLTEEQLGVNKMALWYSKIDYDEPFHTGKATIIKTERHSKKQANPKQ